MTPAPRFDRRESVLHQRSSSTKVVAAAALALGALGTGCTLHRTAGTGDVAFRLAWEGVSDLDLLVQDPAGDCISFIVRESPSGGVLDVDCNSGADALCAAPVENVYWPHGAAPDGRYLFWAHAHSLVPAEAPLGFELQILRGTQVVWRQRATAREHHELHGAFALELPSGRVSGPTRHDSDCVSIRQGVITDRP